MWWNFAIFFLCCLHCSPFTIWFGLYWAAIWHYSLIPDSSFVGTERTKLFRLCTNKALSALYQQSSLDIGDQCLSVKYQHSSISTLIKREFYFFWKSSIAVAGDRTQIAQTEVCCVDHYTIIAWMERESSMDQFMPHKLLVLIIFGQRPHHGLWPLTSSLLQNDIGK